MGRLIHGAVAAACATVLPASLAAQPVVAPAIPAVDAPELARLGAYPVGVRTVTLIQAGQSEPFGRASVDRPLPVTVWYPAAAAGPPITYRSAMSGKDARDVAFTVPGIASVDARASAGRFPLVVLAHGYGNTPAAMSWLGENLATKGYVVVAPAFRDPPISIRTAAAVAQPLARRPLDIAFVAAEVQRRAGSGDGPFASVDAGRVALIGYSMGGYGVLAAAGAPLDPGLAAATGGVLAPYVGDKPARSLRVAGLKAVVAIAPASVLRDTPLFAAPGVTAITTPTFYIVGGQDRVVGYDRVRTLFTMQRSAPRYLLTFREASHSIALIGAPPEMRDTFWDQDWFEDAVWRKDRLMAVQAHFITPFLDLYVKDDRAKAPYLQGLITDSNRGEWPGGPTGRYAGYSPGPPVSTMWKGFQPSRVSGMTLEHRAPE